MSRSFTRWAKPLPFFLAIAAGPAGAALGGALDTVNTDEVALQAVRRVASRAAAHEVHELTLASGTVVREFVARSGTVFAVAWQGPFKPDLNQLLGAYFPRLVAAGQMRHADHRALAVHAPDLVIESGGRMRAFAGRAYLPEMVPATLSVGEIR
ncbi:MAG TPA: DUF2844 domain-containing protein [Burkholderiaceae bacterium]|nr:DUF2844 domain-containing protein [Burkholderiaceae bacterium]